MYMMRDENGWHSRHFSIDGKWERRLGWLMAKGGLNTQKKEREEARLA